MATEKRKSEQATAVLRMFLLTALEHDAVTDAVHDVIFAHVTEGKYHPTTIPAKLHRVILDVLCQATSDDWDWVARTFISQASEALEVEYPNSTHEAPPQSLTETRRTLRSFDPRQLRASLVKVTRRVGKHTGIRRQQITATDQSRTCPSKSKALAEREQVIDTARKLDPETFDTETREACPGKWERATDLALAVALNIIDEHGMTDEIRGDAAVRGYAWRVNRFVGFVDLQGFIKSEEYPTRERAVERLQDFDMPAGDGDA